ncbi:hypothetical protein HX021_13520 [Sphingobacterium sp. N143]|uniref:hypothetical protein n=1 Tax=Sphingobacterium sp. N143 TaxID=2746727 RepID=UPI002574BAD1|nr:hypothetical protein [Sphingobacterium sp. N143]MDM1295302.1 hypothetical protein [Sphingobacterium sp. N143]
MEDNQKLGQFIDRIDGFEKLSQLEQVKLIAYFYCITEVKEVFSTAEIRSSFVNNDINPPTNISDCIGRMLRGKPPVFVKKNGQYSFHRISKKELDSIYLDNKHTQQISSSLRQLLTKITSEEQKTFLEEAISCFEIKSFRAATIMCWLLTMDVLYEFILKSYLTDFNTAIQSQGKYKKITISKKEHFSDIKENDFIELLRVARLISNDVRKILDEKLGTRNTAAHPNTVIVKESKAINFIEDLIENVIVRFQ